MPGIAAVVTCDSSARRGSRVFDERECLVGLAGNVSGDRAALAVLCARLVAECVSVAVLGQFKRGKSSLPNARPGVPLPPTNVLPLSAVPRFIRLAEAPSIRLTYRDGRVEGVRGSTPRPDRRRLSAERWRIEGALCYCAAIHRLFADLGEAAPRSRGLRGLLDDLRS